MSLDVPHGAPRDLHPPEVPPPLRDEVKAAIAEKRLTLSSWERLLSPGGVAIAAHPKPVLHLMGSFTRNINGRAYSKHFGEKELPGLLDDLRRRKSPELFESPEHEGITDNIKLYYSATSWWTNTQVYTLAGGAQVAYHDTIALAGDFFGVPGTPISDGSSLAAQQSNFRAAFSKLDTASNAYVQGILNIINQQSAQVSALAAPSTASDRYSTAYTEANSGKYYDAWYNGATGGANPYDSTNLHNVTGPLEGMYTQLAGTNWDHFGHHAVTAYSAGHAVALQQAQTARQSNNQNALLRAYIIDAFACHFLSDLFATGHLRTPRKALHASISPFPDLLAQVMHDEDNYNGMMVTSNMHPEGWLAYGDKRMLDTANGTNLQYAGLALQASANEVYAAWSGQSVGTYTALNYIPNLDSAFDRTNANNWKPLFVVPSPNDESQGNLDNTQIRVGPTDLRGDDWITMDDWYVPSWFPIYAYYWELLPGGGVHSLEGAPPSVVASWAHNFQWSQHGRFVPTTLASITAIAAAVLGTDPPAISNNDPNFNDLPQTGKTDLLYLFYRQGNGTQINYLTTPLGNVPGFTAPCALTPGQASWQTSGTPAAIEFNTTIRFVFPDSSGRLMIVTQNVTQSGTSWNAPVFMFGAQASSYTMANAGVPALAKFGATLYLAYRDQNGNFHIAAGNAANGAWAMPTLVTVGGNRVSGSFAPSLMVTDGYLFLSIGSSSSNGNAVQIYRTPLDANGQPGTWSLYLNGLKDAANDALTVKSFAQLFSYADGYAAVGISPNNNNIRTIVPVHDSNPTGPWNSALVAVGNNVYAQTNVHMAVIFYQGNPYLFYADSNADGALTAVTSAVAPLHTIPGGTQ